MNFDDFKRILLAFADDASDLVSDKGQLIVQIRDEEIEASVKDVRGTLYVTEAGQQTNAYRWLVGRIARIPLLADRLLHHVKPEHCFVEPTGSFLNRLDARPQDPEEPEPISTVTDEVLRRLRPDTTDTTSVVYITSDAGEGKTTLINELARRQAADYKNKKTDWLLVPISLGGRSFLTFDDIVVAELVNKFRFQLFYYDAFLEMVRLGVLVPAFDGFEEMFVESSSGEALSTLGNLIKDLKSSGSVLIAVRRAYFHHQNFKTQAKLFDGIQNEAADFVRIGLNRWNRERFLQYAEKRGNVDGEPIYDSVCASVGRDHPVLTRAVLVKRLFDEADRGGLNGLLTGLRSDPENYFHQFVHAIVEREANKKWISRSGTPRQPLLTTSEHHSMLAHVAAEMWDMSSSTLNGKHLDLVAEIYSDSLGKPHQINRQIIKRLRQHSLIAKTPRRDLYAFDHEDFQNYYLGIAVAEMLTARDRDSLAMFLGRGALSVIAVDAAISEIRRHGGDLFGTLSLLKRLGRSAATASFGAENAGALVARLAELLTDVRSVSLQDFTFPPDALKGRRFGSVVFERCEFQRTSLRGARLDGCRFLDCDMHQLEWPDGFEGCGAVLDRCKVRCIVHPAGYAYEPTLIRDALLRAGFKVSDGVVAAGVEWDEDTKLAERALRMFMQATQVGEDVFRRRFKHNPHRFFDIVMPQMIDSRVLEKVTSGNKGKQRYKLGVPMSNIGTVIAESQHIASLDEFLKSIRAGEPLGQGP